MSRAGTIGPQRPRVCVTKLRAFVGVDAADPRWRFRGSPSDEGAPLPPAPK